MMADLMIDLSSNRKPFAIMTAIVIGLLIFANGTAFGLFAISPITLYAAMAAAVSVTVIMVTLTFKEKRINLPKQLNSQVQIAKTANQTPTKVQSLVYTEKSTKSPIPEIQIQRTLPTKQPMTSPVKQATTQTVMQPTLKKAEPTPIRHEEVREEKTGKLNCPHCKKQFSQAFLMADYSVPHKPDLIAHCPYCFEAIGSVLKSKSI
jgi:hypothetical protein